MSKYYGPRLRMIRRFGILNAITIKYLKNRTRPGQHGAKQRKLTQFFYRLVEKQKLRFYYGILEKQLIQYMKKARSSKGPTSRVLIQQLEIRLDTIIFRLGWTASTLMCRLHCFCYLYRSILSCFICIRVFSQYEYGSVLL